MRTVIIGILAIMLIGSFNAQNGFAHQPDFQVNTAKDILKFCEFFYEEYQLLGADSLSEQHQGFPNLRACVILYNHIAWNSTHQARDIVLIAEIEKYLGDSSYIKERHVEYSDSIPNWIKKEAQLWINEESQNTDFAYVIRTMLEAGVLKFNFTERNCEQNSLCFKEGDFIKYSHFDKYGNNIVIRHTVESIYHDEIVLMVEKTSRDGILIERMILDKNGLIKIIECCNYYEFIIPTPISLGDSISENLKIVREITYTLENQEIQSWFASDLTGQNTKIIDKKTGLVFLYEHHETDVLSVGEKTEIIDTNFFDTKYNMDAHQVVIPEWWKTTTTWLLDEEISESEYLRALENLISRNILTV